MTDNGTEPTPEQQVEWLQNELNDAHLVIGRQQVQLLQAQQVNQALSQRLLAQAKEGEQQKEEAGVKS